MPEYDYQAVDNRGQVIRGRLAAAEPRQALRLLRRQGFMPIELVPAVGAGQTNNAAPPSGGSTRWWRRRSSGIRAQDLHDLFQELTALLRAGLPLDRSLRVLVDMQPHPALRQLQQALLKEIKAGRSLSQAMATHAPPFGPLHINMVRAGEVSGKLPQALAYLLEHLDRSRALRNTIVSALIYPSILLVAAVVSVALMLGFVVPQFKPLFQDLGDRLPLLTAAVVWVGDATVRVGPQVLATALGLAVLLRGWWRTPSGRLSQERLILSLPLVGPLIKRYQIGRFTRVLGTLLASGVGLVQSLSIARDGLTYNILRAQLDGLPSAIKQGQRFTRAIADAQVLDAAELQLVALGEETGKLDTMLLELAQRQEHAVELQSRRLLTIMEPMLILGLGIVIAVIIISILLGILSVNELVV